MNYGFCIPNNPTDYRVVKLGVKSDSPLGQAKARQIELFPEAAKNTDDHYYIFNLFYPLLDPNGPMEHSIISPALFNALTVMEANERERKKIEITDSSISIQKGYGNNRSTLAALAQVCLELMSHINQLQVTGRDLQSQPGNLKQSFAQIYRNSLSTIDKTALIIATWAMTRAREQERSESRDDTEALLNEYLTKIPAGYFSDETLAQIRTHVLERQSIIPKNGELFRLQELFTLLPTELRGPAQKYLARLLTPLELGPDFLFALVICFFVATAHTTELRSKLPSRLTRWMDFLVEEYSLEVGNVPESPARQALRQLSNGRQEIIAAGADDGVTWLTFNSEWLDVQWLQWACSVAEGERVLIPFDPLQVLVNDEPAMVKQAVLYVPQE
ncbi:hypothetical protein N7495_004414 [Penicillium taxi]|uniref:uncharacterized protein n=1 Tax=Penicillium taxi TaxID=168475 RepID=UPI002544FBE7|nr:uncharacterized protein N7495_004414 [Penicillium taxi]KAJ5899670.1 hypothetical protein N7495_004414 [Penicillium taxi]